MRRRRTIYFNDARHYYLFVFEPPMRLEEAWRPIDEAVGTSVDTFIYGVARGDGLFYPSEVGLRFGQDVEEFDMAAYWRVWNNMQSLMDRDLDPLNVLIDRAHQRGMDFFASMRMGDHPGLDAQYKLSDGGRGYVHPEVRDYQFSVLEELATRYPVEGVELDFAAAPGGTSFWLKPEDVPQHTSTMTDFVREVAQMVRNRPGGPGQVGARVYPTEELNLKTGLDVRTWLREGLIDYVTPLVYAFFVLDANMPIDWLVQEAHQNETSVYAMMQPYRTGAPPQHATLAMMRAAAASFWELGVDGLYSWFLSWPLGDSERSILTELGGPEQVKEGNKHYFLRRHAEQTAEHDYEAFLPMEILPDPDQQHRIPFVIADDTQNDRVSSVRLKLGISNLVTADQLEVHLNGASLWAEPCRRTPLRSLDPYSGQWLEFQLDKIRPQKGHNILEISLKGRPDGFGGRATVEDVEIIIEYSAYPATSS